MNRRDALKVVGATAVLGTTSALAAMSTKPEAEVAAEEKYMNRIEMKPKDPANMDKGELKHSPQITIKGKDAKGYTLVEITVGQGGIIHPSTPDHWIDFISLSADNKLVGKNTLEPEISRGTASFSVKLDNVKSLTAKAGCNLHGIWTTTTSI